MRIANRKERVDIRKYMEDMRANRTNRSKLSNPSLQANGRSYTPDAVPSQLPPRSRPEPMPQPQYQEDSRGSFPERSNSYNRHMHFNEMKNSLTYANNSGHMMMNPQPLPNYHPQPAMNYSYYQPQQMMSNFSQASQGPGFSQAYHGGFSQVNNGPSISQVPCERELKQQETVN